ncbi:hypothetical protein DL96DRAFT_1562263 [Flagelloscypha sp. PMI_526]|nr:hypothetical protein DL96DRAFT_1562263 [Flagelloscypha sp. PMI_526]
MSCGQWLGVPCLWSCMCAALCLREVFSGADMLSCSSRCGCQSPTVLGAPNQVELDDISGGADHLCYSITRGLRNPFLLLEMNRAKFTMRVLFYHLYVLGPLEFWSFGPAP